MKRCVARMDQGGATDFAHFVNVSPRFLARRDLAEEMLGNAMGYCQTCSPSSISASGWRWMISAAAIRPIFNLARLPVSFLKIEGWLVSHRRQDRKVAGIVESLASFARKEGVLTVADMGVDYGRTGLLGARNWRNTD